jgi:hypothetical protein
MKVEHDKEYIYYQIPSSSTPIVERIENKYTNEVTFDANSKNIPFYIESFTARTLSTRTVADRVFFRKFDSAYPGNLY